MSEEISSVRVSRDRRDEHPPLGDAPPEGVWTSNPLRFASGFLVLSVCLGLVCAVIILNPPQTTDKVLIGYGGLAVLAYFWCGALYGLTFPPSQLSLSAAGMEWRVGRTRIASNWSNVAAFEKRKRGLIRVRFHDLEGVTVEQSPAGVSIRRIAFYVAAVPLFTLSALLRFQPRYFAYLVDSSYRRAIERNGRITGDHLQFSHIHFRDLDEIVTRAAAFLAQGVARSDG